MNTVSPPVTTQVQFIDVCSVAELTGDLGTVSNVSLHYLVANHLRVWEAEDDYESQHVRTRDRGNDVCYPVRHPEWAWCDVFASSQQMWQYCCEVAGCRQNHETIHKGIESDGGSDVYDTKYGANASTHERCGEGVTEAGGYLAYRVAERGGSISCLVSNQLAAYLDYEANAYQSPKHSARGNVRPYTSTDGRKKDDYEQPQRPSVRVCSLAVNLCKWVCECRIEDGVDVVDAVKEGDQVAKTSEKPDTHLGPNSFRDVHARVRYLLTIA